MSPTKIPPTDLPPGANATNATLYISAQTPIRASAKHVYAILTDLARYGEWNTFVKGANVTTESASANKSSDANLGPSALKVDDKITLHVLMKSEPLTHAKVIVREVSAFSSAADGGSPEKGIYRLAWAGDGFPPYMLSAYRVMEVRALPMPEREAGGAGSGMCEFRTWECMNGPLAYVVRGLYGGVLQTRFLEMAEDLKARAEDGRGRMEAEFAGEV